MLIVVVYSPEAKLCPWVIICGCPFGASAMAELHSWSVQTQTLEQGLVLTLFIFPEMLLSEMENALPHHP